MSLNSHNNILKKRSSYFKHWNRRIPRIHGRAFGGLKLAVCLGTAKYDEKALEALEDSSELYGELTADYPNNSRLRFEQALVTFNRGVALRRLGKPDEAMSVFVSALPAVEEHSRNNPRSRAIAFELVRCYVALATCHADCNNPEETRKFAEEAMQLLESFDGQVAIIERCKATSIRGLGYQLENQTDQAIADYLLAIETYQDLMESEERFQPARYFLRPTFVQLCKALIAAGRNSEQLTYSNQLIGWAVGNERRDVIYENVDIMNGIAFEFTRGRKFSKELLKLIENLVSLYEWQYANSQEPADLRAHLDTRLRFITVAAIIEEYEGLEQSVTDLEQDIDESKGTIPDNHWQQLHRSFVQTKAYVLNRYAWSLLYSRDKSQTNTALRLSLMACETSNWQAAGYLDTLACAYADKGNFDKAIEIQTEALTLQSNDSQRRALETNLERFKQGQPGLFE